MSRIPHTRVLARCLAGALALGTLVCVPPALGQPQNNEPDRNALTPPVPAPPRNPASHLTGVMMAFLLGALAGRFHLLDVDPVAADVEVLGEFMDRGHLDRGNDIDPESLTGGDRLGHPGDTVVVGERQHLDAGLGGLLDHAGRFELAVGYD